MNSILLVVSLLLSVSVPALVRGDGVEAEEEFALLAGGPGKGIQATPAVAFGKGVYLVVWREGWHGKGGAARIYAARFSSDGRRLDPRGIEVAPATTGVQERPRVAFCDGTFLVVWQDLRTAKQYDILAARIDSAGRVLDRQPIAVSSGPRSQVLPDVGSDGKGFLVVWQGLAGTETSFKGYAARVSLDGKVGSHVETRISPQPKISWNGSYYLAVCGGSGTFAGSVRGVRLDSAGSPLGKPGLVIRGTKAAAFCISPVPGKGWLVVSHRSKPDPWGWGGPGAIRAALVNADGQTENLDAVKEPAGVKDRLPGWLDMGRAKTAGATWPWGPSAGAFDGRHTVVVWPRHHLVGEKLTNLANSDLIAARVDGFRSLDPAGVPVASSASDESSPALASDRKGRLLLVYERHHDTIRATVSGRFLR